MLPHFLGRNRMEETDYQIASENRGIKKSIVPIIRIVVKCQGTKGMKGNIANQLYDTSLTLRTAAL